MWLSRSPCEEAWLSDTVRGAELVSPALTPGLINADQVLDLIKERLFIPSEVGSR